MVGHEENQLLEEAPAAEEPAAEEPDDQFPFWLTTGRVLEHWHTGSMTRRSKVLDALEPEAIAALKAEFGVAEDHESDSTEPERHFVVSIAGQAILQSRYLLERQLQTGRLGLGALDQHLAEVGLLRLRFETER